MSELFSIRGKVALITGGSRGIGLMIARAFVAAGAKVYLSSRKASVCDQAAEELRAFGECHSLPADLSKMSEVERLAAEFATHEQRLDILINNAGATWGSAIEAFPEQGWDKVMDLNVKSVFFLTQKLLPLLEQAASPADPARVINIGSVDGMHMPAFENFSYGPSKAALHHLTRMLATSLAARSITVNAIAPGPFATDMMAPMVATMGEKIIGAVPLGRMGEGDDIGGVAQFLSSRAGAYVTGAVLPVDGGLLAAS
ncbi:MAG: SDR family oxidoreductase [Gammaproteobacteria bacterium]|jgi:NAD(P)-dependent dehydrogenase (short-subunit alcohol dehydrogenase family)|nr:SDR family oxidoreductase [Gammaproteobacteria bacterium]